MRQIGPLTALGCLILLFGFTANPANAQCDVVGGTPPDEIYECLDDPDGVDVGTGNDEVNIFGTVEGTIQSSGGSLTVIIVGPDGVLNVLSGPAISNAFGSIDSTGDVTSSNGIAIILAGDGSIDSKGAIEGNLTGILLDGSGDVTSEGDVTGTLSYGIRITGDGDVTSEGDVTGGAIGIQILGSGDVISEGDVEGTTLGISVEGNGDINSTGTVTATTAQGIRIMGNGSIVSVGDVEGGFSALYILGTGDITSTGDITGNGTGSGIIIFSGGNVISNGDITAGNLGIMVIGDGTITSTGNVDGGIAEGIFLSNGSILSDGNVSGGTNGIRLFSGDIESTGAVEGVNSGISLDGDGQISATGSVSGTGAGSVGISGSDGDQNVTIAAVVDGQRAAVDLGRGNDTVTLTNQAEVSNTIVMGAGDDIVIILPGAIVNGVIDGGEDEESQGDLLDLQGADYCAGAELGAADAGQLTLQTGGQTYTIRYFERFNAGARTGSCPTAAPAQSAPIAPIQDGRINNWDAAAPVAVYCNVEGGVNVWAIDAQGVGTLDLSIPGSVMDNALQESNDRFRSGQYPWYVTIGTGPLGSQLFALGATREFQVNRASPIDGVTYHFTFSADMC
ncbi:MAG: hypothetical protein U0452_13390 [Anaerolineae bacterium]